MFERLKNDLFIMDSYKRIEELEKIKGTAKHDLSHVLNVVDRVEQILSQLEIDSEYVEATKIAALLHDIGCVNGKEEHALQTYLIVSNYFSEHSMKIPYQNEILEAIRDHGTGFKSDSLMTLTLILADKLDLTKNRLTSEGYETYGIRQLQYIDEIKIIIDKQFLRIYFMTKEIIDFKELNEFDFLNKVFKAIQAFSNKQKLEAIIRLNETVWNRETE